MRTIEDARATAKEHLADLGNRWAHVQTVGRLAEELLEAGHVGEDVACAAWLHDVGYSSAAAATGFHPLDGARILINDGWSDEVVGLVAHHTGASEEAAERGLSAELDDLPTPAPETLDAITLIDLSVAPDGTLTRPHERVAEILDRYAADDPVHAAVAKSRNRLLESAERARKRLGLSDDWPLAAGQSLGNAKSHGGVEL